MLFRQLELPPGPLEPREHLALGDLVVAGVDPQQNVVGLEEPTRPQRRRHPEDAPGHLGNQVAFAAGANRSVGTYDQRLG